MSELFFNYSEYAARENIPPDVLTQIIGEVHAEFPFDEMMKELHIVRAISAYVEKTKRVAN